MRTTTRTWIRVLPVLVAWLVLAPVSRGADVAPAPAVARAPAEPCTGPVPTSRQPATVATDDLWTVARDLRQLRIGRGIDPKDVLVVFDLDNTLLAMESLLGSDEWFYLQSALLPPPPPPPGPPVPPAPSTPPPPLVGLPVEPPSILPPHDPAHDAERRMVDRFDDLLRISDAMFRFLPMRRTQDDADEVVRRIQARGCRCMALTSRDPATRAATRRELARASISFADSAVPAPATFPTGVFHWTDDDLASLRPYEVAWAGGAEKLKKRDVSWADGVLMTAGADKGASLRLFLARAGAWFKVILFTDDTAKHHLAMRTMFACVRDVEVHTFWYTREHPRVAAFYADSDAMKEVADEWKEAIDPACWIEHAR